MRESLFLVVFVTIVAGQSAIAEAPPSPLAESDVVDTDLTNELAEAEAGLAEAEAILRALTQEDIAARQSLRLMQRAIFDRRQAMTREDEGAGKIQERIEELQRELMALRQELQTKVEATEGVQELMAEREALAKRMGELREETRELTQEKFEMERRVKDLKQQLAAEPPASEQPASGEQ